MSSGRVFIPFGRWMRWFSGTMGGAVLVGANGGLHDAGDDGGAGRGADGRGEVGMTEAHTVLCQLVDCRCVAGVNLVSVAS